ncbi:MAG TPA: carboxypeptidase-like regulatory domain-containing protein [Thermoanaerobaculia bacterium]|nr:carboxypeptidase-like regulatory domain-containing protein [Thermoanaerobaculia bacterium]
MAADTVQARLRRIDQAQAEREIRIAAGEPTDLGISEGVWELTVSSEDLWAPLLIVTPTLSTRLPLWRSTVIKGTLRNDLPPGAELRSRFEAADKAAGWDALRGTTACHTEGKTWSCSVPQAALDLQFSLAGFATEFRWNIRAGNAVTNVGTLDFTPGASLSGTVEVTGKPAPAVDRLEVILSSANPAPTDKVRRLTVAPSPRGFFQFKGVPAGRYVVRAAGAGLATAPRAVDVLGGLNAVLRDPLVAAKPRHLSVDIAPILDVGGERWVVELLARSPTSPALDLVTQSPAAADGRWSATGVTPGDYALYVRRTNGSVWKRKEFAMPAEDLSLPIVIEGQRVEGTVRLGDRPIPATLQFEGTEKFVADERGHFEGSVPKLPDGDVTILVTYDAPEISRFVKGKGETTPDGGTFFDVTLPNTTIMGRTINPDGTVVPFATLNIRSEGAARVEQPSSGEDGRFQIAGLEPGLHKIQAEAFKKSSAVMDVEATDSASPVQIDIILRDEVEERGQVMMGPLRIPAAAVYAHPRNVATSFVPQAKSDANGRFVLYLPPGTETYDLLVIPPGFAAVAGRVVRNSTQPLHVETVQTGGSLIVTAPSAASTTVRRDGGEFRLLSMARAIGGTVERKGERDHVTVPNLEPGRYEVCSGGRCSVAFVPPLATATISFDP